MGLQTDFEVICAFCFMVTSVPRERYLRARRQGNKLTCSRSCAGRLASAAWWSVVKRPPRERFLDRVGPEEANGCTPWMGRTDSWGYGRFNTVHVKPEQAHRYAYREFVGPIPAGMVVMHSCDNRRCVNTAHLSVGTQKDNVADMLAKGRQARGYRRKSAKGPA